MSENPKMNVSLKLDGAKPWVTVYGDTAEELAYHLDSLAANGIGPKAAAALESLKAGFEVGQGLGGVQESSTPVQNTPYPPGPAAPAPPYGGAPAPTYQGGYSGAPSPAPAAPAAPPAGGAGGLWIPGLGMEAKMVSGTNKFNKPYNAWADPRPREVTQGKERTDDVNHPGLAAGTHTLFKFIR